MNKIKLTTTPFFVACFLLCGLMIIQTPAAPQLSANGKIAFTSDRDGNSEIYLMNADGSGQVRLTNNSVRDDFPTWSPDGRTIAFLRQSGGISSINLMNADGTNVRQITMLSLTSYVFGMSWSPDGAKIAFQDLTDIFIINVDGSNRVNLTNGQGNNSEPTWSPDGSRLAFARSINDGRYTEIYTMNVNGSDVRQITISPGGYTSGSHSPDWSPDSGRLAFTMPADEFAPDDLALVNPDGTYLQLILENFDFVINVPKWSPDGTKIVFYGRGFSNNVSQIWVINRDGSGLTQLTNNSPNNFNPDWQPLTPELGLIVTRSDDRNNTTCVTGDCSLREAVNAANASATDDTINFASGLTTITLTNEIVINNAGTLTINGLGANVLTIDGGAGTNRIFYINQAIVTISGVTLMGGNGTGERMQYGGGAILAEGNSLTLDGVHVTGNTTSGSGGGVLLRDSQNYIINSTFSGNTGLVGGGFGNYGGNLTVVNSTISGNTGVVGGGISNGSDMTLRNVTITNNTASNMGGGIFQEDFDSRLTFGNSIVAGNICNSSPEIFFSGLFPKDSIIISAGGNLVGDSPGDSTNTGPFSITYQPTDIQNINPMLGVLANNGGSTPTHALLAGSPAIDKGLNNLVSPLAPAFDQRGTGFARIRDGNGDNVSIVDIGAFEAQSGSTAARPTLFDFDGDGKADVSVFRPSNGTWYINQSTNGFTSIQFGFGTDKLVPADYDGDGKTDVAVYRGGTWYLQRSSLGFTGIAFGASTDIPVPADFSGESSAAETDLPE
ncbi:MAG: FG-GAP-like repeat-containing protein [Acidobacteria bacterium]|nr:FG-GAP-like repeat-containing protein [Acidobacteriota bacterium]